MSENLGVLEYPKTGEITFNGYFVSSDGTDIQLPEPKRVVFAPPLTIVYWDNGEKTIVSCAEEDSFSESTGVIMAYLTKVFGSCTRASEVLGVASRMIAMAERPQKKE